MTKPGGTIWVGDFVMSGLKIIIFLDCEIIIKKLRVLVQIGPRFPLIPLNPPLAFWASGSIAALLWYTPTTAYSRLKGRLGK